MSGKINKNRFGFADIVMRDRDNNTVYKSRGQNLGNAIIDFEQFLKSKYGIVGFSALEKEPVKKRKKPEELPW